MPEGHHRTRTGHPVSAKGYFSAAFMISKTVAPFRMALCRMRPTGIPNAALTRFARFAEAKEIKNLCAGCRSIAPMQTDCLRTVLAL